MPDDPTAAERAIVVQLLDRARAVSPAELYAELSADVTPSEIDNAVLSLARVGVIRDSGDGLSASPALQRLDTLGLIAV